MVIRSWHILCNKYSIFLDFSRYGQSLLVGCLLLYAICYLLSSGSGSILDSKTRSLLLELKITNKSILTRAGLILEYTGGCQFMRRCRQRYEPAENFSMCFNIVATKRSSNGL